MAPAHGLVSSSNGRLQPILWRGLLSLPKKRKIQESEKRAEESMLTTLR
jgi:hypothetical protein